MVNRLDVYTALSTLHDLCDECCETNDEDGEPMGCKICPLVDTDGLTCALQRDGNIPCTWTVIKPPLNDWKAIS